MKSVSIKHREKMVRVTAALLPSKGLAGLSLVEVARLTGAPRGSLYHYFPGGWDELIHDALSLASDMGLAIIDDMKNNNETPDAIMVGLGARLKAWLKASDYEAGCPVAAVALSASPKEPAMRARCADIYACWVSALDQRLRGAGFSSKQANGFAQAILDCYEGALLRARVQKSIKPINAATAHLREFLQQVHAE